MFMSSVDLCIKICYNIIMKYYDGTKLLSLKDINGEKPEIYLCATNRSAGKTTYFSRLLVNRFLNNRQKFGLIYRFNYELDDCADKFFKDINSLFFVGKEMTSKKRARGIYHELFLDDDSCGYALALNNADQLKRYSHLFNDIDSMLFDEFQSESNHYCSGEVNKFISLHTSIARGQGKMSRYVPVYMLGNRVSLLNPYYSALGISERLQESTKFLRGEGFVIETSINEDAKTAQSNSQFNRAFSGNDYLNYQNSNQYLNDNTSFIVSMHGKSLYIATIRYNGHDYAVREYSDLGIVYVDTNADSTFPVKLSASTADHQPNYVMIRANQGLLIRLRYYFENGCFRFKNLECKEALINTISY